MEQIFKKESQFILLRSLVEEKVFESEQSNYTIWDLNELFVLDNNITGQCILLNGLVEKDREILSKVLTCYQQSLK